MAIIKCKMCGGDIEFTPGATYGTCEYCGSTSTIPTAEDEQKLNRYNRANHYRRQCEFDKALSAYEKILEQDETDAEAHWGAALSRYGIEYVEDPATKQRIPTCHRLQIASILADADYLAAVQYAPDGESRRIYEAEAARIAEIQKGILAISASEEPYDVFICYKETDEAGKRTRDSQWAQDVYYGLTDAGYKVFFSRITLEDKLGQQYEPYIFAALNSAKVMVVIGSRPEYFNAVWVKNEWSRYLALMAKDRHRLLIPCYRDMDPYDLPEELSALQSQDMSKIGFMQDLLRGVKKVLEAEKPAEPVRVTVQAAPAQEVTAAPGISSLMERAYLFMEDGDFGSAGEYLNRVLDYDPKYAPAYAAKTAVTLGMRRESDLGKANFLYEDNADWQKALRFADPARKAVYEGYLAETRERVEKQIRDFAFDCAMEMIVNPGANRARLDEELNAYRNACLRSDGGRPKSSARKNGGNHRAAFRKAVQEGEPGNASEKVYLTAAEMLESIGDAEAMEAAGQCRMLAEQARQKKIYMDAEAMFARCRTNPAKMDEAAQIFRSIPRYKDALAMAEKCAGEAEALRLRLYNEAFAALREAERGEQAWSEVVRMLETDRLNRYRDVEQMRQYAAERLEEWRAAQRAAVESRRRAEARKKKVTTNVTLTVIALIIAGYFLATQIVIPEMQYGSAMRLRENGQYDEAAEAFAALGDYKDADTQILETCYQKGIALMEAGEYDAATAVFEELADYGDAATQAKESQYRKGMALFNAGKYGEAEAVFAAIAGYNGAETIVPEYWYQSATAYLEAGEYDNAVAAFTKAGNYLDAETLAKESRYRNGMALMESGEYDEAYSLFLTLRGYADVDNLLATDENLAAAARDAMFAVGDIVEFGHYPQTRGGTDNTPVEWIVLARDGSRALLLSRYGLDAQPYNEEWEETTWAKCTLRGWLNDEFLNRAFTEAEQTAILLTDVDNGDAQGYSGWDTDGGSDTQDRIFLLSYAEAHEYLGVEHYSVDDGDNAGSRVAPTAYAKAQGASTSDSNKTADGEPAGWWWLRSPGNRQRNAADVRYDGALDSYIVDLDSGAVRPAFWVNLESGIF